MQYFWLRQISANIENEDVVCPNQVAKRANIATNIMLGEILDEMLCRWTGALRMAQVHFNL